MAYLDEQADATGVVPDDRTIVVERFRDEIGDWRVCIHSPYGARVHAPWATILRNRLDDQQAEVLWSDDGIVVRLPEAVEDLPLDVIVPDPDDVDAEVVAALPGTATFAARFREAAARALLLPRRRPGQRTPLWQQRQRAADLLSVAARYPAFPILLEATRECCNDDFDLPALREVLTDVRRRHTRVVAVETASASPFARQLLFGWIAVFMYEGDAPLAERRAAALSLDRELLRDLLGAEELRSLLDPAVLDQVELELQHLVDGRGARDTDELHDLLRVLGPLTMDELRVRLRPDARTHLDAWLEELTAQRRVIAVSVGGERRLAAAEDAARLRDALGAAIPVGLPTVFTDPVDAPLARTGRTPRPHTRSVQDRVGRYPARSGPRCAASGPGRAGGRREGRRGGVPPRRHGGRMGRHRRPAPAPSPFSGRSARRGGPGRYGGAGAVPDRLAGRWFDTSRRRCDGRGGLGAPGRGDPGIGARGRCARHACRRLPPVGTRPAVHGR
ncbi:MAG: hypothetical protein V9E94_00690 [Microthrixaceae bacterium]